jgi:hypothetical protein
LGLSGNSSAAAQMQADIFLVKATVATPLIAGWLILGWAGLAAFYSSWKLSRNETYRRPITPFFNAAGLQNPPLYTVQ